MTIWFDIIIFTGIEMFYFACILSQKNNEEGLHYLRREATTVDSVGYIKYIQRCRCICHKPHHNSTDYSKGVYSLVIWPEWYQRIVQAAFIYQSQIISIFFDQNINFWLRKQLLK